MSIEVKVPVLPESVSDATIAAWHKKAGEAVKRDENLVDLETDKVVLEVPAPADGVLKSVSKSQGAVVTAEEVLGVMEAGAVAAAAPSKSEGSSKAAAPAAGEMSPSVRRLAAEHEINSQHISGTGKGGRVTKDDIMSVLKGETKVATPAAPAATPAPAMVFNGAREEKRVPMSRLRTRIAERLVEAQ